MKRISDQKRKEYENATQCYICCYAFEKYYPKDSQVCDHEHLTEFVLKPLTVSATWSARSVFKFRCSLTTAVDPTRK